MAQPLHRTIQDDAGDCKTSEKIEALRAFNKYGENFQALLRDVAANALHHSPCPGLEFSSLYSPAEIISGYSAADDAGLTVEEGVAIFVFLNAAVHAEIKKRGGFFERLKMKFPPKPGTPDYNHVAMLNRGSATLPYPHVPSSVDSFTARYDWWLQNS